MGQQCCDTNPDPDDPCQPCYLTATWESQLPPESLVMWKNHWVLATTGAGDRNGGSADCPLPVEHTHSHVQISGNNAERVEDYDLINGVPWVYTEDSLLKNLYQYYQPALPTLPPNHKKLISDGKVYRYYHLAHGNADHGPNSALGYFYIPWASILNNTYTKAYEYGLGSDWHGQPITDDIILGPAGGSIPGFDPNKRHPRWIGTLRTPFLSIDLNAWPRPEGSRAVSEQYTSLADWRIMARFWNVNGLETLFGFIDWDIGMNFGQWTEGGAAFRIEDRQTSLDEVTETGYHFTHDTTFKCLTTSQEVTYSFSSHKYRCESTTIKVDSPTAHAIAFESSEIKASFANGGTMIVSPVNTWWMDHCDTTRSWVSMGYWNRLAVLDIDGNDDGAGFICRSFRGYRFDSSSPFIEVTPDEGEFTLNSGRVIQFDARVGDTYVVAFDNLGNETTEVTDVTFDGTIVTGVDRTTETFTPYEYNTFTLNGALLPGGASNLCSPASSASINPSKLTLTGDSPDVINPSDSFSMTYNGTTNKFAMSGSNNIIFKNYNSNTAYTCNVQLQVLRGGTPKVNLSHDVSDSMESDTNVGSTVSDASMTLNSAVSQLNLTNPGGDTTASIMDPDPYVPNFGDVVRLKLTLTGNSDSVDYVRIWESTIDCTTGAGAGGLQDSNVNFIHNQSGDLINSPFTLKLRSSNGIK